MKTKPSPLAVNPCWTLPAMSLKRSPTWAQVATSTRKGAPLFWGTTPHLRGEPGKGEAIAISCDIWALVKTVSIFNRVLVTSPHGRSPRGYWRSPFYTHISFLSSLWQHWQENRRVTQSNNNSFLNSGDIWLTCFQVNNIRIAVQLANNDGII